MIEFLYQQWARKELFVQQNKKAVMKYSASNICKKLVKVFNEIA